MNLGKVLKIGWAVAVLVGFLAGSVAVYAAWQHNPQQEFHSPETIKWIELSMIWFSWFLIVATVLGGITSSCLIALYKLFRYIAYNKAIKSDS